ncbi:MAG: hypothetical protein PVH19_01915 [Planctomycetia bacterium]
MPAFAQADEPKVVIPFDFQSKFDEGRYGKIVGDMVWKKLEKQGKFVIPEAMLDVRDTLESNKVTLSADTPIETVKKLLEDQFGGQIAIWGSVERVPGNDFDVYDLKVRCVDFSAKPKPKVIYTVDARTKTVSEIPHKYLKAMFDALYEKGGTGSVSVGRTEAIEKNWADNPNLIVGGDFQTGSSTKGVPKGWDTHGGQLREPVGNLVQWQHEGKNRFIRLSFDKKLGDTFGVMYYSDRFPVTEGTTYRFQCRWRSDGPKVKVFVKCYDATSSDYHEKGKPSARSGSGSERLREIYRSQQNLDGPKDEWNVQTEDFTPKHTKYTPRWGRVMLYGYLGAGNVDFDDVVVKEIVPGSIHDQQKDRRHSLESGVTLREQEENRRRSKERKQEQKHN